MCMMLATLCVAQKVQAVEFAYDAGAELVSAYLWRGQYNGGLSFQPDVEVGFDGEHTSFRFGVWGSVGASDWKFQKGLPKYADGSNPNTYFVPEMDLSLNFQAYGVIIGATHYYYFGGSPFFNWTKFDPVDGLPGTSQTEVSLGYDFRDQCEFPLTIMWNTMVAGDDLVESGKFQEDGNGNFVYDEEGEKIPLLKRAFSTYIEAKYDQPLPFDMTLSLVLGISPWASDVYGNKHFAVNNIAARLDKEWEFDACSLNLFVQGSINTDNINKTNVFVWEAGDDKLYQQKLNGCFGLGVWF